MPRNREAVWDPHRSLGPIPAFVCVVCLYAEASQYRREQLTNGNAAAMPARLPLQRVGNDSRFVFSRVVRQLLDGCVQLSKKPIDRCPVVMVKPPQFLQN